MKHKHLFLMVGLLSIAFLGTACGAGNDQTATTESQPDEATQAVETTDETTPVTYENFQAIEIGTEKKAAQDIFGPGEKIEGIVGNEILTWQGQGIGNMVLVFDQNKVVEKTQTDLAERSAEITAEQASAVTPGMPLADAEAQLGPAVLVGEKAEEDGSILQTYEWKNQNGSVLTVSVQDDVIVSAMPVGLE